MSSSPPAEPGTKRELEAPAAVEAAAKRARPSPADADADAAMAAGPVTAAGVLPAPPVADLDADKAKWLHVGGVKKYETSAVWTKRLAKEGFPGVRVRKDPRKTWALVRFGAPEQFEAGKAHLEALGLEVKLRDMAPSAARGGGRGGGARDDGKPAVPRTVHQQVTPLAGEPYEKQLQTKYRSTRNAVSAAGRQLKKLFPSMKDHLRALPPTFVPLEQVQKAPVLNGYRNKTDFTIGTGEDKRPVVGFLLGSFGRGFEAVAPPDGVLVVKDAHAEVARRLTEGLVRPSGLPLYDRASHTGVWRRAMVRTSDTSKQMMVLVQVQGQYLEPAALDKLRDAVRTFAESELKEVGGYTLASLFFQVWDGRNNSVPDRHPTELLSGAETIQETVLGSRFHLSWGSFFQVNTPGAEELYRLAGDWALADDPTEGLVMQGKRKDEAAAKEGEEAAAAEPAAAVEPPAAATAPAPKQGGPTVLLDVCCGTGTIGLTLADRFDRVAGFEIVESAVEDAKKNAALNGVTNAEYYLGPAEETLRKFLQTLPADARPVAIVDPPRSGLHVKVLTALRNCARLERIVYVSCNPKSMSNDLVKLVRPRGGKVEQLPFRAVRGRAVDMFPHTEHCEMVVVLQRATEEEASAYDDANFAARRERKAAIQREKNERYHAAKAAEAASK